MKRASHVNYILLVPGLNLEIKPSKSPTRRKTGFTAIIRSILSYFH